MLVGGVEREQTEGAATSSANRAEVSLIETQNVIAAVAIGQHDDRRVRKSEAEIGVAIDDGESCGHVGVGESFELICPIRYVDDDIPGDLDADTTSQQIVELGEDEGRENTRVIVIENRQRLRM